MPVTSLRHQARLTTTYDGSGLAVSLPSVVVAYRVSLGAREGCRLSSVSARRRARALSLLVKRLSNPIHAEEKPDDSLQGIEEGSEHSPSQSATPSLPLKARHLGLRFMSRSLSGLGTSQDHA